MHALTGRPASPLKAREIAGRSDGIPLLVEELVAAEDSGRVGVPPHLRDLYLSRVDALSAVAAAIVKASAVAGSGVLGDTVVAVSGVAQEGVTAAVEEAVAAGCLVTDGSEYGFRHELLREAVYESLVPSRRRALHEALARTLAETGGGNAATVARHWLEGAHPSEAAACSITAAEEAERLHAPGAAHAHFERVLELWNELPASERHWLRRPPSLPTGAAIRCIAVGQRCRLRGWWMMRPQLRGRRVTLLCRSALTTRWLGHTCDWSMHCGNEDASMRRRPRPATAPGPAATATSRPTGWS